MFPQHFHSKEKNVFKTRILRNNIFYNNLMGTLAIWTHLCARPDNGVVFVVGI